MFEFIGIAVVTWFPWQMAKAIIAVSIKRTLQAAAHQAARLGAVPFGASQEIIAHPAMLKDVRRAMAKGNRDFGALDASEQYGRAITAIHQAKTRAHNLDQTMERVRDFLTPQIAALHDDGVQLLVDQIVFAYVGALAIAKTKQAITFAEIKKINQHVFQGEKYRFRIDDAWSIIMVASDNEKKLATLIPLAQKEVAADEGQYLVKYGRSAKQSIEDMFNTAPRPDLSMVSDDWFLKV